MIRMWGSFTHYQVGTMGMGQSGWDNGTIGSRGSVETNSGGAQGPPGGLVHGLGKHDQVGTMHVQAWKSMIRLGQCVARPGKAPPQGSVTHQGHHGLGVNHVLSM